MGPKFASGHFFADPKLMVPGSGEPITMYHALVAELSAALQGCRPGSMLYLLGFAWYRFALEPVFSSLLSTQSKTNFTV